MNKTLVSIISNRQDENIQTGYDKPPLFCVEKPDTCNVLIDGKDGVNAGDDPFNFTVDLRTNLYRVRSIRVSKCIIPKINNITPYNNTLKIAVLLTGNVQHISTLISQKFFIYDILKPDIYAVIDCNELLYQEINDLLKPKYINFNYKTKENFENNTMVDFHKIILANQQKKNYEVNERKNYDIVIRIRADLFVKNYIPSNIINNIEENTIYVPLSKNNYFSLKIGINDYFALSNSNVMDKYVNYFNYLKDIYNKKNIVQCSINEYLLKKYIENNGIKIVAFPYVLVIDKLKSNQIFYFYVMIKQYFKNLNDKFHCVLDDVDFS